jgi:polysaccharide biosynthesis/export protein
VGLSRHRILAGACVKRTGWRREVSRAALAAVLLLCGGQAGWAQEAAPPPVPPRPEPPGYRIAPGDVLRITVWNEPSLSTDAAVRLDGRITVPLLGDLQASGRTPEELTIEIRTNLRRFVEVPQVTVSVAQAVSARFYVIGEVVTSGSFAITGRITVLQALAIAGGFREFARRERIMIIRDGLQGRVAISFNYRDLEVGSKLEQDIPLQPGDVIIVP